MNVLKYKPKGGRKTDFFFFSPKNGLKVSTKMDVAFIPAHAKRFKFDKIEKEMNFAPKIAKLVEHRGQNSKI